MGGTVYYPEWWCCHAAPLIVFILILIFIFHAKELMMTMTMMTEDALPLLHPWIQIIKTRKDPQLPQRFPSARLINARDHLPALKSFLDR